MQHDSWKVWEILYILRALSVSFVSLNLSLSFIIILQRQDHNSRNGEQHPHQQHSSSDEFLATIPKSLQNLATLTEVEVNIIKWTT